MGKGGKAAGGATRPVAKSERRSEQPPARAAVAEELGESEDDEDDEDDESEDDEEEEQDIAQTFFLFAKGQLESGQSSVQPRALAALQKARSEVLERNAPLKKLLDKALKRDENDTRVPPGSASVRRSLSDDRFLLCSAAVLSSQVLLAQGKSPQAQDSLREALVWFPRSVAANLRLGELLRGNAAQQQTLDRAEWLLRRAVETGQFLREDAKAAQAARRARKSSSGEVAGAGGAGEGERTTEEELALEAEAEELQAAKDATEALLLYLCQAGRDAEAGELLRANGYKWRLSRQVLHYPLPPALEGGASGSGSSASGGASGSSSSSASGSSSDSGSSSGIVRVLDDVLNTDALTHLQYVFRPDSAYWSEHNYDTALNASSTAGYYSYLFPLDREAQSSVEQVVRQLHTLACESFPQAREAKYAEWWVHSRPHCSGHQLHFDSDETRLLAGSSPRHPLVSTVLYLGQDSAVGGPTVVTDQLLEGNLGTQGWMVPPRLNRLAMFDARYLHGVVPGRGLHTAPHKDLRRLSFMVGFWSDIAAKDRGVDTPGPGQPFPDARSTYTWPSEMQLRSMERGWGGGGQSVLCEAVRDGGEAVRHLTAVWEGVPKPQEEGAASASTSTSTTASVSKLPLHKPSYDTCFQGF